MDNLDASSSSQDSIKSSGSSQANKNRKGSLSAVIDKLSKSARHVNDESPPNTPTISTPSQSIGGEGGMVSSTSSGQTISKDKTNSVNTQSLNLSNGKCFIFRIFLSLNNIIKYTSIVNESLQFQRSR